MPFQLYGRDWEGTLTIGENKSISIEEVWIFWCILHDIFPQRNPNCCHTHGTARVTTFELFAQICYQASESFQNPVIQRGIFKFDVNKLVGNPNLGRELGLGFAGKRRRHFECRGGHDVKFGVNMDKL